MFFKAEQAHAYLEKWQSTLRLRDWDIEYRFVEKEWRKTGDVKIDRENKRAIVLLNNFNPKVMNLEEVIIHELLHIKLWDMDQLIERLVYDVFGNNESDQKFNFAYDQFMSVLEKTVQDLTKGYLETGGQEKKLSFGRLEQEVEEEINK